MNLIRRSIKKEKNLLSKRGWKSMNNLQNSSMKIKAIECSNDGI